MSTPNVQEAIRDLDSTDLSRKIQAVDVLTEAGAEFAPFIVRRLTDPEPARFLIYERIGRLGAAAVPSLVGLLADDVPHETRLFAAAALLHLGSTSGLALVLESAKWGDPNLCVAARALAAAKVPMACAVIVRALREAPITAAAQPAIDCLLDALKALDEPIPADVRTRLGRAEPPWLAKGWRERIGA